MRTINQLTSKFDSVWFQISVEYKARFVDECNQNGYKFDKGEALTTDNCGLLMSLHAKDKTVWYVSGMIWSRFLKNPETPFVSDSHSSHLPVNYKAFADGNEHYVYGNDRELIALEDYSDPTVTITREMFKDRVRSSCSRPDA